jgi:hypothetical protein
MLLKALITLFSIDLEGGCCGGAVECLKINGNKKITGSYPRLGKKSINLERLSLESI